MVISQPFSNMLQKLSTLTMLGLNLQNNHKNKNHHK